MVRNLRFVLFTVTVLLALTGQAYLDPSLKSWYHQDENRGQSRRVLLLLKRDVNLEILKKQLVLQATAEDYLPAIRGLFTEVDPEQLELLFHRGLIRSAFDSQKKVTLEPFQGVLNWNQDRYTYGLRLIKVPEVRKSYPQILGSQVDVGVIDSGISPNHHDLRGRLKVYKNFSPSTSETPFDGFGHGTHVAGTIAGGSRSGLAIGVAPQANLIVARIFGNNAESTFELVLKSMQWMLDPDGNPATKDSPRVVNSSWGSSGSYADLQPSKHPFCQMLQAWLEADIVPVFAAGNTGPKGGTINLPAGCPQSFSVGAVSEYDQSPWFSSVGPARWKTGDIAKPEVSAPGVDVKSASHFAHEYTEMSGTSMAAPHVTGAFALLFQAFPQLTAAQAMRLMIEGSQDRGTTGYDPNHGWGRIDILKTLEKAQSSQVLSEVPKLEMSDVSILYPLPELEDWEDLISAEEAPELLPYSVFDLAKFLINQPNERTYPTLRVVGVRVDPCFTEGAGPVRCQPQIRFVWQPLVKSDQGTSTLDASVHAFFHLSEQELEELVTSLRLLRQDLPSSTMSTLGVHPILTAQGLKGTYAVGLRRLLLKTIEGKKIQRMTFMKLKGVDDMWFFGGFDLKGGKYEAIRIPLLDNVVEQEFINSLAMRPRPTQFQGGIFPASELEPSMELIARDSLYGEDLTEEQIRSMVRSIASFENPQKHNPGTLDCVSCHLTRAMLTWADRRFPAWDLQQEYQKAKYQSSEFDLTDHGDLKAQTNVLRMFGYFERTPLVAPRTLNESVEVMKQLSTRSQDSGANSRATR